MAVEHVMIDGTPQTTLRELLRPGLRIVLIGINPSPVSVAAGHYHQGRLGKQMWRRLESAGIAHDLRPGLEDEDAFQQGIGCADIVRRPSPRSVDITNREMRAGTLSLSDRLGTAQGAVACFVYARARDFAMSTLAASGWPVATMPGPYAPRADANERMTEIAALVAALENDS